MCHPAKTKQNSLKNGLQAETWVKPLKASTPGGKIARRDMNLWRHFIQGLLGYAGHLLEVLTGHIREFFPRKIARRAPEPSFKKFTDLCIQSHLTRLIKRSGVRKIPGALRASLFPRVNMGRNIEKFPQGRLPVRAVQISLSRPFSVVSVVMGETPYFFLLWQLLHFCNSCPTFLIRQGVFPHHRQL